MTPRERFLTAIRNEQPDSVPVCPDISNMIPCRLTGRPFCDVYHRQYPPLGKAYLDALDYFKFDGWVNYGGVTFTEKTQIETESKVVGRTGERLVVAHRHRTPAGDLTSESTYYVADPPTATEKMIKNLKEDFAQVRYLL